MGKIERIYGARKLRHVWARSQPLSAGPPRRAPRSSLAPPIIPRSRASNTMPARMCRRGAAPRTRPSHAPTSERHRELEEAGGPPAKSALALLAPPNNARRSPPPRGRAPHGEPPHRPAALAPSAREFHVAQRPYPVQPLKNQPGSGTTPPIPPLHREGSPGDRLLPPHTGIRGPRLVQQLLIGHGASQRCLRRQARVQPCSIR